MRPIRSIVKEGAYGVADLLGVNACLRRSHRQSLLVLCYHSIAPAEWQEEYNDPNVVRLRKFREQMELIASLFSPVSAGDVLDAVRGHGRLPPSAALVTLDDGLKNNLTCAVPVLQRLGIPAIVFVSTGYIGTGRVHWTHRLTDYLVHAEGTLLPMPDEQHDLRMPASLAERLEIAARIRAACKRLPDAHRRQYLARLGLADDCGASAAVRELFGFLSWDDLRVMRREGIEIGSHSVEHPILTTIPPEALRREMEQSKAAIERELSTECPYVAYPNGGPEDYSPAVIEAARGAGYEVGFTLCDRINTSLAHPLELERLCITGHQSVRVFKSRVSGLRALLSPLLR